MYILYVYFVAHSLKSKMDESEAVLLSTLSVLILTDERGVKAVKQKGHSLVIH